MLQVPKDVNVGNIIERDIGYITVYLKFMVWHGIASQSLVDIVLILEIVVAEFLVNGGLLLI